MLKRTILLALAAVFLHSCATRKKVMHSGEESLAHIKSRYASLLGVSESSITNLSLYTFINNWLDVPYKYAGKTKAGTDCSGFASILYKEVFGKSFNGPSHSIYHLCQPISRDELNEGDLVFFRIESAAISHVGVYLHNDKFVHASTQRGVIISDLKEAYYSKYYFGAGRMK